jgi:hypothetical protein
MKDEKISEYGLASIVYKATKQYEEDWKRIVQQKDSEIENLKKTIQDLTTELEEFRSIAEKVGAGKAVSDKEKLEKIINDTLRALPVGNINTHTPDTIPERVQDWVKEAAEECRWREKWEELADRLIVYAEEISYQKCDIDNWHEKASKDIEQYEKLKKLTNAH